MINLRKLLRPRAWLPLAALAASISMGGQAWAAACAVASIATYTAAGFSCTIDDKTFFGFADTLTAGGGASAGAVGITLTPITTVLNPGFNTTLSGFSVGAGQSLDLKLAFNVAVNPGGNPIDDVSLGIAGA